MSDLPVGPTGVPVVGTVVRAWRLVRATVRSFGPVPGWEAQLNQAFRGEFVIHGRPKSDPSVIEEGPYPIDEKLQPRITKFRADLEGINARNELQAALAPQVEPDWRADPLHLHACALRYAEVLALRASGAAPRVLSGNAVVLCRATRELILQLRGDRPYVRSYPRCVSTFGGGYVPGTHERADRGSLLQTVSNELAEEAKIRLSVYPLRPMIVAEELSTRYIQLVVLGFNISRQERDTLKAHMREGTLLRVGFDELPYLLRQPLEQLNGPGKNARNRRGWVPSGKAHVLAWLALGAPGAGRFARFDGMAAQEVFADAVKGHASPYSRG